jgi:hypothetical protein
LDVGQLYATDIPSGTYRGEFFGSYVIDSTNLRTLEVVNDQLMYTSPAGNYFTMVSNLNPQTHAMAWSTAFGMESYEYSIMVNPQGNMVVAGNPYSSTIAGPDYTWASAFVMAGATINYSFDFQVTSVDEVYPTSGLLSGNVAVLSCSSFSDLRRDLLVAVDVTTQQPLWAFSTKTGVSWIGAAVAQHPTDATKVVYAVSDNNNVQLRLHVVDILTGAVASTFQIDTTPVDVGSVFGSFGDFFLTTRNGRLHMSITSHNNMTSDKHVFSIVDITARTLGPYVTVTSVTPTITPHTITTRAVTVLTAPVPWLAGTTTPAQVITAPQTVCPASTWVNGYTPHTLDVDGYIGVTKGLSLNGDTGTVGQVVTRTVDGARWGTVSGGGTNFWRVTTNGNTSLYPPDWVDEDGTPTGDNGTRYTTPYNPQDYTGGGGIFRDDNIALGRGTMYKAGLLDPAGEGSALTVTNNIAVGAYAMYNMGRSSATVATSNNVAIGTRTCANLTEGDDNVAIGKNVMNGVGVYESSYNVAIGSDALPQGGSYTVALGQLSGPRSIASGSCTWIGSSTGHGVTGPNGNIPTDTIAIGSYAAYQSNSTPGTARFESDIIAIGSNALAGVQTAAGAFARVSKTTAVGANSLWEAKAPGEGQYDNVIDGTTVMGHGVGYRLQGTFNTAVGYNCMKVSTRSYTTAVGVGAGEGGSGNYNTFVGGNSGGGTVGEYNTHLGYDAGYYVAFDNTTCIGYNSTVTGSDQVQLGNAATTTYAYGAVQNRSDARDKADVRDTVLGLNFITALRPVDFKWNYRESYDELVTDENGKVTRIRHANDGSKTRSRYHHGVIAQEVKAVMDQAGVDFGGFQDHAVAGGEDVLSIGYDELIAPMIKAIQELTARLEAAEAKIALLEQ